MEQEKAETEKMAEWEDWSNVESRFESGLAARDDAEKVEFRIRNEGTRRKMQRAGTDEIDEGRAGTEA